ncbi:MAG: ABC transporter permease subunit [Brevefilum sp.]|nr:ABC transporter permease subunit [Brevefilum sp.]
MIFLTSLRKEFLESLRRERLLIILSVFLVFGLTSPLLAKYTPEILKLLPETEAIASIIPEPTLLDSINQFVKNINQFGFFLAILLTMGTVSREKEKGTASMVLVKPLPRSVFLFSKFIALSLTFLISLLITSVGAFYYSNLLFTTSDFSAWLWMAILLWLIITVYVALTLLFSTLFRSQPAAAGVSFGVMILFLLLGSLPTFEKYLPDRLSTWAINLFTGGGTSEWTALLLSLGIIALSLLSAWLIFRKQELE